MKTLRFCFVLFGLFFCINGNLKAQFQQVPQVSIKGGILTAIETNEFSVTVESDIPTNLAIRLQGCGACEGGDFFPVTVSGVIQESGYAKTEHTFYVQLEVGEQAYLTCGYVENYTNNYKASDGGCIIGVRP